MRSSRLAEAFRRRRSAGLGGRPDRGAFIVVAGPDGTGKSAVVDALVDEVLTEPLLRLHHRPRVLGGLAEHGDGPVTDPHGQAAYSPWLSHLKLLFLWADHLLGWLIRIRPWRKRGGDVVLERGWWDLLVDPRRYRLQPSPRLVRTLGALLPRPDITLVLGGDAEVIAARKGELSTEETARQLAAWRMVPAGLSRPRHIDVGRSLDTVGRDACRAVSDATGQRWIGLPDPSHPRWILPVAPACVAVSALGLHQPVTTRSRGTWKIARGIAAAGGFRLLRTHLVDPPRDVVDLLGEHVPPGARVAVANGSHAGRSTALILDGRTGVPIAFAKLAFDAEGPDALRSEADRGQRFAPLLPPGLSTPRLLHRESRLLLFEVVASTPRRRPWELSPDLASLLGRFYRNSVDHGHRGVAHGDCAPWNLLRTASGWWLVDWADARDDAAAFEDLFHHLVQTHALLGRPRHEVLVAAVSGRGPVAPLFLRYAEAAGVDLACVRPLLVDYLRRSSIPLTSMDTDDGRAGLRSRAALLGAIDREGVS